MKTPYNRAAAIFAAAAFAAQIPPAYATSQAVTQETQTHYVPLPAQQATTIEGLVDLDVSAKVAVKATDTAGHAKYNAQGPATGVNRFEYRVDVEATQKVEREVQEGTATVTQTVSEYVPVTGYQLRVWATPADADSLNDPRDDILLQNKTLPMNPYGYLKGTEIHAMDNNKELIKLFPHDGKYIIYTEGFVEVLGKEGKIKVPIRGLESGPSYDVFEIAGAKGSPYEYPSERVQEWLNAGLVFTKGGIFSPRMHHTFIPEGGILYKAGDHWGRHFAVFGTDNFDALSQQQDAAPLFEELYLLGVTTEEKGERLIIHAPSYGNGKVKIEPGQHLVARFDGERLNSGTAEIALKKNQEQDGSIALEQRVVDNISIPAWEGLFAVERVLNGYFGVDKNNDGTVGPDEWELRPIAKDVVYVQMVPRGFEAEAFAAGLLLGGVSGYVLGHYVIVPTPESSKEPKAQTEPTPTEQGSVGFGESGSLVE